MDLRSYIDQCAQAGELRRVTAPVDWNLEISHISKLVEERKGPALLFENVKGYSTPVFTGAFATTKRQPSCSACPRQHGVRVGPGVDEKTITSEGLIRRARSETARCSPTCSKATRSTEHVPVPSFFPLDGGRYIGTVFVVLRDPETGETNLGTYRMQMLDGKTCGVQILPGKRGGAS